MLDWTIAVVDVPNAPLKGETTASEAERQAVAEALGVEAVGKLVAEYQVKRLAAGGYRLTGRVRVDVTQACVVTLQPIEAVINEPFDVEFWPSVEATADETEQSILDGTDREAIENGRIALGRIVFETLSAALDPYPRSPDAAFEWSDEQAGKPGKISPFAVLSKLRRDSE